MTRGFVPPRTIRQVLADEPQADRFLIDGLLHTKITLLWGKSKVGKSVLVRALIAALLNGSPEFLGRPVLGKVRRVLVITTDSGGEHEYGEALARLLGGDQHDRVLVQDWSANPWTEYDEEELRRVMDGGEIDLVVLDNLQGALRPGESVNDDAQVRTYTDLLRRVDRAGPACLLVHHCSEKPSVNGVEAGTPMGASMLTPVSRASVQVSAPRGKPNRIRVVSNDGPEVVLHYRATWEDGVPTLAVLTETETAERPPRQRTEAAKAERAAHLLTAPASDRMSAAALGRWWAEHPADDGHRPASAESGRTRVRQLTAGGYLQKAEGQPLTAGPQLRNQ